MASYIQSRSDNPKWYSVPCQKKKLTRGNKKSALSNIGRSLVGILDPKQDLLP